MRICIYGAGVIGSILAGHFARAGHEVSALARGSQLDAIRDKGLTVENADETFTVKIDISDQPADLGEQDLVIVATKAPSHDDIAAAIGPLLGPDTLVGFAVNGIFWFYGDGFTPGGAKLDLARLDPDAKLHNNIGAERAMGVVCFSGGAMIKPGTVHMTRPGGRFIMGAALAETSSRAGETIGALDVTGLTIEAAADIRLPMWKKFVTVASNQAVSSLTGASIGQNQGDPAVREINIALMGEVIALAAAHGFNDLGFDLDAHRKSWMKSPHKPSMLQDLELGRVMEIDSQYVIFQNLARQAGIATPILDTILPLLMMRARIAGCYGERP